MPTYDYVCPECRASHSRLRPIAERDEPQACTSCGFKGKHDRPPAAPGIALKGDGWARDGYGGKPTR